MICYLCKVADPNEVHYNPKEHQICMNCSVKLWELAQSKLEFDMRDDCVIVCTKNPISKSTLPLHRQIVLSSGYEIDLDEENGLEHLFNAVFGESLGRAKQTEEFSSKGFSLIYDICISPLMSIYSLHRWYLAIATSLLVG